jgi:hypothetical protein
MLRFHLMGTLCLCFEKKKKTFQALFLQNVRPWYLHFLTIIVSCWHTVQQRTYGWMNRHWIPQVMVYSSVLAMTLFGVFPEQWVSTTQKLHYISLSLYSNNACLGYLQGMHSYHRENILHLHLHSHHIENTLCLDLPHIPVMAILGFTKWCAHAALKMCHCFPWTMSST